MNRHRTRERRHKLRHDFSGEFRGKRISSSGTIEAVAETFHAKIQNVGEGGLGLAVDQKLNPYDLIRGEVVLPNVAVGIPSIFQVRWIKQSSNRPRYQVGLQFLL